jgi:predicted lipid-binding transport protein (Tim44 family)
MSLRTWTKSIVCLFALVFLCAWALEVGAWARVGGGRSFGSRGSRSMSAPRPYTPSRPSQPSSTYNPTKPATPLGTPGAQASSGSFWRSFGGGMLGGLAGGLLFRSLFGGPAAYGGAGTTGGGGIGLFDILLLAGIAYLVYCYINKKRREAEATAGYYQSSGTVQLPTQPQYPPLYDQPQAMAPGGDQEVEQGLANIRQFDPGFDEARFQDMGMDTFFKIQGAWANRDMSSVRNLLTDEMYRILQEEADRLKAQKQINRLENIAVRSVDITEAWQESGYDFITVRMYANLLDYNMDENTGQVVFGSKTEPVKFEEYWTFTRPVGNNAWQLSAINQA